ncbi:MAG TPA: nucleoside diphosphate kinase regulator [Sphingopyxis sp.]|uniref:nucleoside diphosphate kinase regulator n=1 Tax=Sphingopyxis sp. TaxID=1908224 RepID=UPI002C422FC2|nr:nucleoside diphosphate kinase regulator [Sphingopyxis sp.]HWW57307.1 nucleoside diphosphate kinase regulator [Sphingopyxis sp.]
MSRSKAARPKIRMIDSEADTLTELTLQKQHEHARLYELLLGEIDRATICSAESMPANVVTMGSQVTFLDEKSGAERTVSIVYPGEADISGGRISIMTPIGAGLIGLSIGQSIQWPDRNGVEHKLTIIAVQQP